jgi:hypothetical protein
MAQIVAFPRTLAFTRAFEELPLFTERAPNGDFFFAGLINGTATSTTATSARAPASFRSRSSRSRSMISMRWEAPIRRRLSIFLSRSRGIETMTLHQWDREVAPYLHVIERTGREVASLTEQMRQAVRLLQARPEWPTKAAEDWRGPNRRPPPPWSASGLHGPATPPAGDAHHDHDR